MTAIQRFRNALQDQQVDECLINEIFAGCEGITDRVKKSTRATFFIQAIDRMDALLDPETCHAVRDACACSKGGWRLKAAQKIARDYAGRSLEDKVRALQQATHMGNPHLNEDGTLSAGIGTQGGFPCPCPVFDGITVDQPVSPTYCYCCAGHFRFHYQIALGKTLITQKVISSILESGGRDPCRFVYAFID